MIAKGGFMHVAFALIEKITIYQAISIIYSARPTIHLPFYILYHTTLEYPHYCG